MSLLMPIVITCPPVLSEEASPPAAAAVVVVLESPAPPAFPELPEFELPPQPTSRPITRVPAKIADNTFFTFLFSFYLVFLLPCNFISTALYHKIKAANSFAVSMTAWMWVRSIPWEEKVPMPKAAAWIFPPARTAALASVP